MTVRELWKRCLTDIGALGVGQPLGDDDGKAGTAKATLLTLADLYRANRWYAFTHSLVSVPLVANTKAYTIGRSSADIDADRPLWLPKGKGIARVVPAGETAGIPIAVWDRQEYHAVMNPDATSDVPIAVTYEPTVPNGTLTMWPVPLTTATVKLLLPNALADLSDPNTVLVFPPGYEALWVYGFEEALCVPFRRQLTPVQEKLLAEAKRLVAEMNDDDPGLLRAEHGQETRSYLNIATALDEGL